MSTLYVTRDVGSKEEKLWKSRPALINGQYFHEFGYTRSGWLGYYVPEGHCYTIKVTDTCNDLPRPRELWGVRTIQGKTVFTLGKPKLNTNGGLSATAVPLPEMEFPMEPWTICRLLWNEDGPVLNGDPEPIERVVE